MERSLPATEPTLHKSSVLLFRHQLASNREKHCYLKLIGSCAKFKVFEVINVCHFYSPLLSYPATSSKETPVLVAINCNVIKLILLAGLIKISAINSFLSITSPVLLVSSHTTKKSVIPLLPCTSLKKGSTMFLKFALVNSSLNSNNWNLEAVAIAFSKVMNNLLTLILSKALGAVNPVLSPKRTVPCPGNVAGIYSCSVQFVSLVFSWIKRKFNSSLTIPLLKPAGENRLSATRSVLARPATSPFSGTNLYTSLYLSYVYL